MTRIVDRGAITAAYVGIGMAVVTAISFLLVIPIELVFWLVAPLPSGLLIGYYANQRSDRRRGPWRRIVVNGLFAGLVTGLTMAVLLLGVKALFFFGDNGYRDASAGGPITCTGGADCVYQRYVLEDGADGIADLQTVGVTDPASFTGFYWTQQLSVAGTIIVLTTLGGLGGAFVYGVTRQRPTGTAADGSLARTA